MKISDEFRDYERWEDNKELCIDCSDYELTHVLPIEYGTGVELEDKRFGKLYSVRTGREKVITLKVTSWRGISCGAVHYYGSLHIPSPVFKASDDHELSFAGYGVPCCLSCGKIELNKHINTPDLVKTYNNAMLENNPADFDLFKNKLNDYTRGFFTAEEVKERAQSVFEQFFAPAGWKFKID